MEEKPKLCNEIYETYDKKYIERCMEEKPKSLNKREECDDCNMKVKIAELDSDTNLKPPLKKHENKYINRWESAEFTEFDLMGCELEMNPDLSTDRETLMYVMEKLLKRFRKQVPDWKLETIHHERAILLVALHLDTGIYWDYRCDVTATRVLATLYNDELRTHKEGIFYYSKGHWRMIQDIPERIIYGLE